MSCINMRDLGGLRTTDGRETRWGAAVRSGSLDGVTPAGWEKLHKYGIRTIVDLRNEDELGALSGARPAGIDRVTRSQFSPRLPGELSDSAQPTQAVDAERLRDYLLNDPAAQAPALPGPNSRPKRVTSVVGLARLRKLATAALKPATRRRLAKLSDSPDLRLHLGSGFVPKEGWIDIDLAGAPADLVWNLKNGIPFADGTVEAVFHEHLLEHLPLQVGFGLTTECHRALKPGGVLRVAVPDAGACLRSYAGIDDPDWARSRPTPMLAVQALFYEHGHHAMYDAQLLVGVLAAAGFVEVASREFGDSRLSPCPDTELRRDGTLYVEGVKPR